MAMPRNSSILEKLLIKSQTKEVRVNKPDYVGNLPVSGIGCIYNGQPIINCPRIALLKTVGVYEEMDYTGSLTTAQGIALEDFMANLLQKSDVSFAREVVVKYHEGDIQVSGRADFVVDDSYGIEFKTVCSVSTAKTVVLGEPKPEHVIQASIYSNHLSRPFLLMYWNSNHLGKFQKDNIEYKMKPFRKYFDIIWKDDVLTVNGKETVVTLQGIRDFINMIDFSIKNKELPLKITGYNLQGVKEYNSSCQFCSYDHICANNAGYDDFVNRCRNQQTTKEK